MGRAPASLHYLTVLLGLLLLGAGGVAGFNAAMDPLWFFTHAHPLNRVQPGFDERAQKTNWLQARPGQFNAVMLGSSRSTYIDQNDLAPLHLFNYSVNAMWPQEYRQYLDHFAAVNGRAPDLVIMGVDFFGSQKNFAGTWRSPEVYLRRVDDPRYMVGSLLSLSLLERSLRVAVASVRLTKSIRQSDYYDRNNVRHFRTVIEPRQRQAAVLSNLLGFRDEFYRNYSYNEELPQIWADLRRAYPHTRFVVFTTPETGLLFALLVREGRLPSYERWLGDLVSAFDEVWDFMGPNSVTTDLANYRDAQHFHPRIGTLVANRLLARPVAPQHGDFGQLVSRHNLAKHLALVRSRLHCLDPDPISTARARLDQARVANWSSGPMGRKTAARGQCRAADQGGMT